MTKLEYFHVFEAILYGLTVTQLFTGWNIMIQNRRKIRFYWGHLLLTIECFFIVIIRYHNQIHMSHIDSIHNPFDFIYNLILIPGAFYFVSHQIFPKKMVKADFKKLMINERAAILYPMVIYAVLNGIENIFEQNPYWNYLPHFTFAIILIPSIHIKKLWLLELVLILGLAYFIFMMFKTL